MGAPLARWIAAARLRAAGAPYEARVEDWERRAAVRMPGVAAVPWREIPARLAALAGDAATRRALGEARARLAAAELAPLARERAARTCAALEALDLAGSYDDAFARLAGESVASRAAVAADWLARTDAVWADTLAERARRAVGLAPRDLVAADLPAVLGGGDGGGSPRGSALAAAARTQVAAMGLDPDARGRVRLGLRGGEAGGGARVVPVRVPEEVYLLVPGGDGAAAPDPGGPRAYLAALGRALHLAYADPARPFEVRWQSGAVAARATGALLGGLLRDRGWLRRYAGLSGAALDAAARGAAFRELAAARALAARTVVSAATYGDEVALGDVEAVYAERTRAALGVEPGPGEAMADLEPPFALGDALGRGLTAGALAAQLRERFDEDWWRNPRTGAWLATAWFAGGDLGGAVGVAAGGPADGAALAAALVRTLE